MSNDLGMIKKVDDLRVRWKDEEKDFTPWLANNINYLNEAVSEFGLKLKVEGTEQKAGGFFVDILAKDTVSGESVIIENQLEKTDHNHLGKAITYASTLDASTVIWIAADFTKEHSRALDWLNGQTKKGGVKFYGVQIELWQTDDGKQVVRFNVVKKPGSTAVKDKEELKNMDWDKLVRTIGSKKFRAELEAIRPDTKENIDRLIAIIERKPKPKSYTSLTPKRAALLAWLEKRKTQV
jgi:hypothetical protein